jgi:hypothetical protein
MSGEVQPSETKMGRPSKRSDEVIDKVIAGLREGTPLTIICDPDDMPCDDTVRNWAKDDPELSRAIARAREAGFDRIAMDAIDIADDNTRDTITVRKAGADIEVPDTEWIMRSKLRVETRLKLLSKWDPKRYGDRIATEISGPDGGPIQTEGRSDEDMAKFAALMADAKAKVEG